MWDIFKRTNIHIMGVPKGEKNKKKKNQKQILEEIGGDIDHRQIKGWVVTRAQVVLGHRNI